MNLHQLPASLVLATGLLALAGCASRTSAPGGPPVPTETVAGIQAFEAVCLKTAPSFGGAVEAAESFGIGRWIDSPMGRIGMTQDQRLGAQIKPGIECVITTPTQDGPAAAQQFGLAVARATGGRVPGRFPVAIVLRGQPFIFHHDRDGGEAFLMLKPGASGKP